MVTSEQGVIIAKKIGATHYFECSALANIGVQEVFDCVVKQGAEKLGAIKAPLIIASGPSTPTPNAAAAAKKKRRCVNSFS